MLTVFRIIDLNDELELIVYRQTIEYYYPDGNETLMVIIVIPYVVQD